MRFCLGEWKLVNIIILGCLIFSYRFKTVCFHRNIFPFFSKISFPRVARSDHPKRVVTYYPQVTEPLGTRCKLIRILSHPCILALSSGSRNLGTNWHYSHVLSYSWRCASCSMLHAGSSLVFYLVVQNLREIFWVFVCSHGYGCRPSCQGPMPNAADNHTDNRSQAWPVISL